MTGHLLCPGLLTIQHGDRDDDCHEGHGGGDDGLGGGGGGDSDNGDEDSSFWTKTIIFSL